MSINIKYNPNSAIHLRIWDHAALGLKKNIGDRKETPRNIVEKGGDAILWTTGLLTRAVKELGKSLQDPRVVTVLLTVFALFLTTLIFYPTPTITAVKASYAFAAKLIVQIPFWAVKFSAYILTCATILGAGLRAGGRFSNRELMNEFKGLPKDYPHNPARLYPSEVLKIQNSSQKA